VIADMEDNRGARRGGGGGGGGLLAMCGLGGGDWQRVATACHEFCLAPCGSAWGCLIVEMTRRWPWVSGGWGVRAAPSHFHAGAPGGLGSRVARRVRMDLFGRVLDADECADRAMRSERTRVSGKRAGMRLVARRRRGGVGGGLPAGG